MRYLLALLVVAAAPLISGCAEPQPKPAPAPAPQPAPPPPPPPKPAPQPARGDGHIYECSKCGATSSVPGNCPQCDVPMKRQG
ncbi:hypothetical protein HY251_10705 [bacterium]|nr:hypothetical protein [bacterium]